MKKLEFRMDIPAVTREYTPGSCRNSRKPMRLSPLCEMWPDSPALCPEQLRFPNQTRNPSSSLLNTCFLLLVSATALEMLGWHKRTHQGTE